MMAGQVLVRRALPFVGFWQTSNFLVRISLLLVAGLTFLALFGPVITLQHPNTVDLTQRLLAPNASHWLGTDHLGRDILARLIGGVRVSLGSVVIALAGIIAVGIIIGGAAGFIGGRVDQVLMRITDIFMTFPTLVLALFMIGMLGTGLVNVIVAIVLSHWAWYARIVRSIVISAARRDYILASRLAGAGPVRVFIDHLLPATLSQLLVLATLDVGHIMLHVAGLSFLGLGVAPPTAEWGVMINDARQFIWTNPLSMLWPGLALFLSVMAFNVLGDKIRDQLDPFLDQEHAH